MSEPLPAGPYDLILADPPWYFGSFTGNGENKHAEKHYATMDLPAICALPVAQIVAPDAVLLLWATMPFLPRCIWAMEFWGFHFRTVAFTWVKLTESGSPALGLGHYTRANAELCLLGVRGKGLPVRAHDVPQVLLSRRREHSQKPDGQYDHIGRLFGGDVRRLEMFGRRRWPGWDAWGNEAPAEEALMLPLDHAS